MPPEMVLQKIPPNALTHHFIFLIIKNTVKNTPLALATLLEATLGTSACT